MLSTFLLNLLTNELVQAFCWMLVHSLWLGMLFIILTGLVVMATIRSKPAIRYNIIAALFFLFLSACGITFFYELLQNDPLGQSLVAVREGSVNASPVKSLFREFLKFYDSHSSWVAFSWAILFCWKVLQLSGAIAYNHRLKQQKRFITDSQWLNRFAQLREKLGIQKDVAFFETAMIKIPVVIGHLKPVIFLPAGLLTSLSPAEVEAILLHELAHIKRKDYLVNFCQLIGESIFFFNPALLWMSSILREERENCCDDMAIATTNSKISFIQALVSFREQTTVTTRFAMAFPAAKNQLLKRVSRILYNRNTNLDAVGTTFFVASLLLLSILVKAATDTISLTTPNESEKQLTTPVTKVPPLVPVAGAYPQSGKPKNAQDGKESEQTIKDRTWAILEHLQADKGHQESDPDRVLINEIRIPTAQDRTEGGKGPKQVEIDLIRD